MPEAIRADHDPLGTGEEQGQLPNVQEHEGDNATRALHDPNFEEELTSRRSDECSRPSIAGSKKAATGLDRLELIAFGRHAPPHRWAGWAARMTVDPWLRSLLL